MIHVKNFRSNLLIYLLLILIVGWLQYYLLEPHLNYGFTPDDWWPLKNYNYLEGNFFFNLLEIWKQSGAYLTYQVLFIGIMHNFFAFNFESYQLTNHILKGLSALVVYPLIYTIFRSKLLAFIATILYAMAYAPVGTLELVVRGSDFIAIIFLCIFFIFYYKSLTENLNNFKDLSILILLLIFSMFLSPIRIYPALFFIIVIELYLVTAGKSKYPFISSLKRIAFLFSPYILLVIISPSSVVSFTVNAPAIISRIIAGNWQLLLYPLGSFGSLFYLNENWKIFGMIRTTNLFDYVSYLLSNPLIIFAFITLFYSIVLSLPSSRFLKFCTKVLATNFVLQLLIYVLAKHAESLKSAIRMDFDYIELYPVFLATYILVLTFFIFKEWLNNGRDDKIVLALWIGPVFSFIYIFWTWLFKDWSVLFKGVHTYLNIPTIGVSLFLGATLFLVFHKIRREWGVLGKYLAPFVLLLLVPIFNINKSEIFHVWELNNYSMNAKEHEKMRNNLFENIPNFNNKKPSLFYLDTSVDYINGRFYEQSTVGRFSDWMYFKANFTPGSCAVPVFMINNFKELKSKFTVKDNIKGFKYHDYCWKDHFYSIEDFYAFRLINKQAVDFKDEILKQLELE